MACGLRARKGDGAGRGRLAGGLLAVLGLLLLPSVTAHALDEIHFFRIGTAASTGTYFSIGGALASALSKPAGSRDCERGGSCGVPGLAAIAQASQGSVQNVLTVGSGQLESALAQADVAYWAYSGTAPTPKRCGPRKDRTLRPTGTALFKTEAPLKNLRAIAGLFPEEIHVVVRSDSPISSLQDLRGKHVALGEPESGTLADARLLLEAVGLSECDLTGEYFTLAGAASALADGRIDAFFEVSAYPVPAISDIAATTPIRLLPIPSGLAKQMAQRFSFFTADVIPAGTYPGIDHDTATLDVTALWITRAEIDEDLIYAITRSLWSPVTRHRLAASHPAASRIRLATALDRVSIPLHPGAARFYREAGLKIPDGL